MKKIACLIPVYRRPEITEITINHLKKQTHPIEIFIVGDSDVEKDVAQRTGVNFIKHPNDPLSKKMQYGLTTIRKYNPDGVMICGSDSWLTTTWVETFIPYLNKYDLIGKSVFYTLEVNNNQSARLMGRGYNQIWAPVGSGRILSKRILDKTDWKVYSGIRNKGLDTLCLQIVRSAGGKLKVFTELQHTDEMVLSLKSNSWEVITSYNVIMKSKRLRRLPDVKDIDGWMNKFFPQQIDELRKIFNGISFDKPNATETEKFNEKIKTKEPKLKIKNDKINILFLSLHKYKHMSILLKNLKNTSENLVTILASDNKKDFLSSILCNKFYDLSSIKSIKDISYKILEIITKEKINIVFPTGVNEAIILRSLEKEIKSLDCKIMGNSDNVLKEIKNKYSLFRTLSKNKNIKIPNFYLCENYDELIEKSKTLLYPDKKIFVRVLTHDKIKFILDYSKSSIDLLNNTDTFQSINLEKFQKIFPEKKYNFKFLISEYIEGPIYRNTCLSYEGNMIGLISRHIDNDSQLNKIISNNEINNICNLVCSDLDLSFINCIEIIDGYVINVDYDIDKFIYSNELNECVLALKLLLDELDFNYFTEYKKILKDLNYSIYNDLVTFKL